MKKLKKLENLHIYFIGIGGISMSGLAKMSMSLGAEVSGSDEGENFQIQELLDMGVKINKKHKGINVINGIDIVVYTVAIRADNPELMTAKALGIKTYERAEFLGMLAKEYKNVISVAGTHGKTTTTAMIGEIFTLAELKPTIHIGGKSVNLKDTTIIGDKDYFILEACEYKNSFRFIKSTTAIVTNVELDHVDYYKDYQHILSCFQKFVNNSEKIIIDKDINIRHKNKLCINDDVKVSNIVYNNIGYDFDITINNEFYAHFRLNILGCHNVINAVSAIATAYAYGIDKECIVQGIANFNGVERRYEKIGNVNSIPVIIDYAHHPSELRVSIQGLKQVFNNPLFIFQPHTYTRTLALFDDFVSVLQTLDKLYLYATYSARESEILGGRAEDLSNALGCECMHDMNDLINVIANSCNNSGIDAVIVLGAGNISDRLKKHFIQKV